MRSTRHQITADITEFDLHRISAISAKNCLLLSNIHLDVLLKLQTCHVCNLHTGQIVSNLCSYYISLPNIGPVWTGLNTTAEYWITDLGQEEKLRRPCCKNWCLCRMGVMKMETVRLCRSSLYVFCQPRISVICYAAKIPYFGVILYCQSFCKWKCEYYRNMDLHLPLSSEAQREASGASLWSTTCQGTSQTATEVGSCW